MFLRTLKFFLISFLISTSVFCSQDIVLRFRHFHGHGSDLTIRLTQGDIAEQEADIFVNAANCQLAYGTGVCQAIFDAAGKKQLQKACNEVPVLGFTHTYIPRHIQNPRCLPGNTVATKPFGLQRNGAKFIFQTVGPDCRIHEQNQFKRNILKSAYSSIFDKAYYIGHRKETHYSPFIVACPSLSTGNFGFNLKSAARIALRTILDEIIHARKAGRSLMIREFRLVLYTDEEFAAYKSALNSLLEKSELKANLPPHKLENVARQIASQKTSLPKESQPKSLQAIQPAQSKSFFSLKKMAALATLFGFSYWLGMATR